MGTYEQEHTVRHFHCNILYIITTEHIQPVYPHYCVFLFITQSNVVHCLNY